ncbi:SWIM zinc finger family protein [Terracidiphilus sp.]|uniref:SWIM zinc finger family protein n=1 Tax=Terracidiphilus sp. TaxID=1964191 RepID=UPI003C208C7D
MVNTERHQPRTQGKRVKSRNSGWAALTWDDLVEWAGERSVSRGRAYQGQGRVDDLAIAEDGRLLATVAGGDRYAVTVWCDSETKKGVALDSRCACPVGHAGCKHAVAVVAEYLDLLERGAEIPAAEPDDERWEVLSGDGGTDDDADEADEADSGSDHDERADR